MPVDFPKFLYEIGNIGEGLSPSAFHEKGILELVLEGCKIISPKLKDTLISNLD